MEWRLRQRRKFAEKAPGLQCRATLRAANNSAGVHPHAPCRQGTREQTLQRPKSMDTNANAGTENKPRMEDTEVSSQCAPHDDACWTHEMRMHGSYVRIRRALTPTQAAAAFGLAFAVAFRFSLAC